MDISKNQWRSTGGKTSTYSTRYKKETEKSRKIRLLRTFSPDKWKKYLIREADDSGIPIGKAADFAYFFYK